MKTRCEDAPCCGCCGTNLYGVNQESSYDEPDYDAFYEQDDDYCCDQAADLDGDLRWDQHDGDCHNYDGAPYHQWETTEPAEVYMTDQGYEDRAMESALFGDC